MLLSDTQDPFSAKLKEVGVHDIENSVRLLREMAGNGVTDDDLEPLIPLLLDALRESPDPDRALSSFARWFAVVGSPYSHLQTLLHHPVALHLFALITGSSQYFADLLVRNPEYFEIVANPGVRGGTKTAARFLRDASALVDACQRLELKKDALRRWKAREMLRIGVRDIAGLADMPSTAREFSNLADACVQKALDIALATIPRLADDAGGGAQAAGVGSPFGGNPQLMDHRLPFAVIGMGKLGGRELNYSSDIDLMFVSADALPLEVTLETGRKMETVIWLGRLGEAVIKTLNEETANGHVFRIDMRLRPEGRFGPLVRSLASYRAYYESWAEGWERQALIKARFIAGDLALGEAFMAMVAPYVYRRHVSADFLNEVRANKRRIEQKCALEGETDTNVKTGFGGIRDIEFLVQLLQLELGGRLPQLRTPNTLSCLERLRHAGILTDMETHELSEDYQFLRTLEHRLQLLHGFQTQIMPADTDDRERMLLARRMGYANRAAFEADLQFRRSRVHGYLDRLFYNQLSSPSDRRTLERNEWADVGALLDNAESPLARQQLVERLLSAGFTDMPAALRALQLPMRGNEFGGMPPDTPEEFKRIAPHLLALAAHSAQPDNALAGIEAIALAVPNRAQLYASFDDSPEVMARMVNLSAASPPLLRRLTHHQEWMETLFAEDEVAEAYLESSTPPPGPNLWLQELSERLKPMKALDRQFEAIARYYLRETLRIGARDVWDQDAVSATATALTRLAEAVIENLLRVSAASIINGHPEKEFARETLDRVAVVGLGKLGGEELGYSSDWDIVFVFDDPHPSGTQHGSQERFALANALAERVNGSCKFMATYGANIEMDLRLRPWGRKGPLVVSPRTYLDYFKSAGETWERQAALKGRFIAGNHPLGARTERILRAVSYGRGVTPAEVVQIQEMKRRIEAERLKPGQRETDLKLGFGGLSDMEWLVQRLQLEYGSRRPKLREPNTLKALSRLGSERLLDNAEVDTLAETYALLSRLRNGAWLQTGQSHDSLSDDTLRRVLARRLGYSGGASSMPEAMLWRDVHAQMREVRRIFEARFYRLQA